MLMTLPEINVDAFEFQDARRLREMSAALQSHMASLADHNNILYLCLDLFPRWEAGAKLVHSNIKEQYADAALRLSQAVETAMWLPRDERFTPEFYEGAQRVINGNGLHEWCGITRIMETHDMGDIAEYVRKNHWRKLIRRAYGFPEDGLTHEVQHQVYRSYMAVRYAFVEKVAQAIENKFFVFRLSLENVL